MDVHQRAQNVAANILSRKMYTCKELFERLCKKGFDKEIAESVVADFISAGYLDDKRFAELYVEDSIRIGAKGIYRIKQELRLKGISDTVIQNAIEECEADSAEALCDYVEQRQLYQNVHNRHDLEKLKARLVRRGYSLNEVNLCLKKYTFDFDEVEW